MKTIAKAFAVLGFLASASLAVADEPTKIAFVDTGNTGRSVTAEAIAAQVIAAKGLHVAIISRGVDVDPFDITPEANAAALLSQHGVDVSAHRAVQLNANDVRHADVILTMTAKNRDTVLATFPDAKDKTFLLAEYATGKPGEIADAYGKPMAVYETMFGQVSGYVPAAIENAIAKVKKN